MKQSDRMRQAAIEILLDEWAANHDDEGAADKYRARLAEHLEKRRQIESSPSPQSFDLDEMRRLNQEGDFSALAGALTGKPVNRILLRKMSDIQAKETKWIVPWWIPSGAITLLAGPPGIAKTTLTLKIAAGITGSGKWADGSPYAQGEVIGYFGEDDLGRTIKPRLMAHGADCDKISVPLVIEENNPRPFQPHADIELLERAITNRTRLVIIDPALSVAADARSEYSASEIRKALEPVKKFAERHDLAVLMITHFLKRHNSSGSGVLDRVHGSQAWGAVARMVLAVDSLKGGKTLMRAKSNLGPNEGGWTYDLEQVSDGLPKGITATRLNFGEPVEGMPDDVFGFQQKTSEDFDSPARTAADWLRLEVRDHTNAYQWAKWEQIGKDAGFSAHALKQGRNILSESGEIEMRKEGFPSRTFWGAPKSSFDDI